MGGDDDEAYDPAVHGVRPGGAHSHDKLKPFDEFVRDEVERRRLERENSADAKLEQEKLERDLEKVREKKRRWRQRHPYDFS